MATGYLSGTVVLANRQYLGVTISSGEYPNGSISWDNGTFVCTKGLTTGVHYYFDLYLCDSSGGNKTKIAQVDIVGNSSGYGTSTLRSGTISGASGLIGKPLYLVAEYAGMSASGSYAYGASYFEFRAGSGTYFSISTSSAYAASTFTANNINFGNTSSVTITINSATTSVYHVVTWTLGSHTASQTTAQGGTSASANIPASWMDAIPNSTTATMTIELKTYRSGGTLIGTTSKTVTVTVGSGYNPSISSITAAIYNQHAQGSFNNQYVQALTGTKVTVNASGINGSTISSYVFTASPNESYTRSQNVFTINEIKNSGTVTFTVTVRDSRGREASASTSISVIAYNKPVFNSTSAFRCNSSGVADEEGTWASIRETVQYSEIDGNSLTVNSVYYINAGQESTAQNDMVSGTTYIIGNGTLNPNYTYYVKFTATDTIGGTTSIAIVVQTAAYAIHVQNGGSGVAFGKVSEQANSVEINPGWNLYYEGFVVLPVIYKDTVSERDAIANPPTGLVCLIPKS